MTERNEKQSSIDKPKITEIYENKVLTRNERNEFGQWETVQKELRFKKPINDLTIGLRLVNLIIDSVFYYQILGRLMAELPIFETNALANTIYIFSFPIYYIVCEHFFQKTLGKLFTQSVVVNEYGEKPTLKDIVVRTVIRFIPFEPLSFFSSNRGWHDKWTNTYVIKPSELDILLKLVKGPNNLKR